MKQLVLRNTTYERIYQAIGLVCLVMVIVVFVTGEKTGWHFWLQIIVLLLLAVIFVSLNFGTLVNRLTAEKGELIIRWYSKPGRVTVRIDEIEGILADEYYILIRLKSGKTVRMPTHMLDFDEKHAVRKFLKETTGF
jgi:hypothetical protein